MNEPLTLGDHIQVTSGYPFASSAFNTEGRGIPLVRIRDIFSDEATVYFDGIVPSGFDVMRGDVLIGMDGTFNIARWRGPFALLNQRVLRLREKASARLHLGYVAYRLEAQLLRLEQSTGQTTVKHLKARDVIDTVVDAPSYEEQRRIAEFLSTLDEQIAQTEALVEKGRLGFQGLQDTLLSCSRLTEAEIAAETLRELVPSVQYGISSSLDKEGVVPVLRMNNLSRGEIDVSELKYSKTPVNSDLLLKKGDVLFNRTNSMEHVGRTAIWRGQVSPATFASYLVRLQPDERRMTREYLVYLLNWSPIQIQMRQYATPGVQQVNINPTSLRRCQVLVPRSLPVQRKTVEILDAARVSLDELINELEKLRRQKNGLADDLLAGRVRVSGNAPG